MDYKRKRRHATKLPHYKLAGLKEIGTNPVITAYLESLGIWEAARGRLMEVYYYVEDEKGHRKHFCAAGQQNENGGWYVRSQKFHGCIGRKGLTIIPGRTGEITIFDDFLAYLAWLAEHQQQGKAIIVNDPTLSPQAATFFNTPLPLNEKH